MNEIWQAPPVVALTTEDELHIWRTSLNLSEARINQLQQLLSAEECIRAARFKFAHHRRRFIAAKATLRLILSRYMAQPADKISFVYNAHGKPELADSRLHFNASDSNEMALYAVTLHEPVGIDIEYKRQNIEVEAIAARFFSDYEIQELQALSAPQKMDAFFNIWTRKEAFIKALGLGLSFPLKDFDVNAANPATLVAVRSGEYLAQHWSLFHLEPGVDYAGAVVVKDHGKVLKLWDYTLNV